MNVLVTGNMGYVGSVVVKYLKKANPNIKIIGYDSGYFAHCLTGAATLPETKVDIQYFGDIRHFDLQILKNVDAVIHLAAISNDPMGNLFEHVTQEINYQASINIAELSKRCGVKYFVFASSCSVYGASLDGKPKRECDTLNPLTAYAKSKIATEEYLSKMDLGEMVVTALRFSTACGASERLRLDLVLNDFVACAIAKREIVVLSDGSPWRPLIDVVDMARAMDWAIKRECNKEIQFVSVNVGKDEWNFQVKDLAHIVAQVIPNIDIRINTTAPPDKRSYSVDFQYYRELAPNHQPQMRLEDSIANLKHTLEFIQFDNANFHNSQFMRLKVLEKHISELRLNSELQWQY
jgi:nucleoside-diphosphate-sugar epimerase